MYGVYSQVRHNFKKFVCVHMHRFYVDRYKLYKQGQESRDTANSNEGTWIKARKEFFVLLYHIACKSKVIPEMFYCWRR